MLNTIGAIWKRLIRYSVWSAAILLTAGSLLRLTIRDRIVPFSAIYYATPVAILALLAVSLCVWCIIQRRNAWALGLSLVAIAWGLWGCGTEIRSSAIGHSDQDQSILLWNMRSGAGGWEGAFEELVAFQPLIAGLVEAQHNEGHALLDRELPADYERTQLWYGLMILARGTIEEPENGPLGAAGRYQSARVTVAGQTYRVVVVDLESFPFQSRRGAIEVLAKLVDRFCDEPLLVMGDFNTPLDSTHFSLFDGRLQHAFRSHGNGYAATWPSPLPVLELDHVWFNDKVAVSDCRHTSSRYSDHRIVEVQCHIAEDVNTLKSAKYQ